MQKFRHLIAFTALFFLAAPLTAQAGLFNAQSQTLPNGLQVVVVENHREPVVTHMLWMKVGAADDPYRKSGLAHYLEHLMFKGTKKFPQGEYSRRIAQVGGSENAFTAADYTAFHATVAREHLPLIMELESDRLANLIIDPASARPELQVILDERRQRIDNDPYSPFTLQVAAALFPHHPYGTPIIGWQQEMETFTTQDAQEFYRSWYHPSQAAVIVSGDVKPAEVFALAQKYYGALPVTPAIARARVKDPAFTGEVMIKNKSPAVHERLVEYAVRAPSYRTDPAMAYALQVLQEIFEGSEAAYLSKALVQEKQAASRIDISYDPDTYDETSFTISVIPKDGQSDEAALKATEDALKEASTRAFSGAAISQAKRSLQRAAILARDNITSPGYVIGGGIATGRSLEEIEAWPERIAAVTPEQLQKALQLILDSPHVKGSMTPEGRPGAVQPITFQPQGPMR